MISKSELTFLKSLRLTKNRKSEKKFLIEGENIVSEALKMDFMMMILD